MGTRFCHHSRWMKPREREAVEEGKEKGLQVTNSVPGHIHLSYHIERMKNLLWPWESVRAFTHTGSCSFRPLCNSPARILKRQGESSQGLRLLQAEDNWLLPWALYTCNCLTNAAQWLRDVLWGSLKYLGQIPLVHRTLIWGWKHPGSGLSITLPSNIVEVTHTLTRRHFNSG